MRKAFDTPEDEQEKDEYAPSPEHVGGAEGGGPESAPAQPAPGPARGGPPGMQRQLPPMPEPVIGSRSGQPFQVIWNPNPPQE